MSGSLTSALHWLEESVIKIAFSSPACIAGCLLILLFMWILGMCEILLYVMFWCVLYSTCILFVCEIPCYGFHGV